MPDFGCQAPDHTHCISDAVAAADAHFAAEGLQFKPVRRRVLELLLAEHRAMGAYEILDHLKSEGLGSQPPIAYRALDFLVTHGFAHRIETLNAFIACAGPGRDHVPVFLICRSCDAVAEAASGAPRKGLGEAAASLGFRIERPVIEAKGLCPDCIAAA